MTRIKLLTIVIAVSCFFVTPAFATGGTSFNQQNLQQYYGGIAEQGSQGSPTTQSGVLSSDLNGAARERYDNLKEMEDAGNLTQDEVNAYISQDVANKNNLNQVAGTVSRTPPANVSGKTGCDFCYSNNTWQACSSRCAAGAVARTPGTGQSPGLVSNPGSYPTPNTASGRRLVLGYE